MDLLRANNVSNLTNELHDDVDGIYESIVDEDSNGLKLIDNLILKLKTLKTNLSERDEV